MEDPKKQSNDCSEPELRKIDSRQVAFNPVPYDYPKLFRNTVIAIILLVIGIATAKPVYLKYRIWRAGHLAELAQKKINQGDFQAASLLAQQSLRLLPYDADSNRIMGIVGTYVGDVKALYFWHNAVLLAPENSDYKLQCAQSAVRFGQFSLAQNLIDGIRETHGKSNTWLTIAASCAMSRGDYDVALLIFKDLVLMHPGDKHYLVNLDCLNLMSANESTREEARRRLEAFRLEPGLSKNVLRNLSRYYRHFNQPGEALLTMEELKDKHGLTWPERVVFADLKRSFSESIAKEQIKGWEEEAVDDASGIYFLANWYLQGGDPASALDLLNRGGKYLPIPSLYFLKAEALVQLKDWRVLEEHLQKPIVNSMEFLRNALLSRVDREFKRPMSDQYWKLAVKLTNNRPLQLNTLSGMAYRWEWEKEAIDIYWMLARQDQLPELGLVRLIAVLAGKKDTQPIREALEMLYNLHPVERRAANDLVMLDLIVGENLERAHQIAKENYFTNPKNTAHAATFAMSLFRQDKMLQALKVFLLIDKQLVASYESLQLIHGLLLYKNGKLTGASQILNALDEAKLDFSEVDLLKKNKEELFQAIQH